MYSIWENWKVAGKDAMLLAPRPQPRFLNGWRNEYRLFFCSDSHKRSTDTTIHRFRRLLFTLDSTAFRQRWKWSAVNIPWYICDKWGWTRHCGNYRPRRGVTLVISSLHRVSLLSLSPLWVLSFSCEKKINPDRMWELQEGTNGISINSRNGSYVGRSNFRVMPTARALSVDRPDPIHM